MCSDEFQSAGFTADVVLEKLKTTKQLVVWAFFDLRPYACAVTKT
jgi:hypothetical protein